MEQREWELIEGVLEECWPGEWTERTGPAYRLMLEGYDPAALVAALRALAARGQRFRPSAGDIIGALERDSGVPSWTEVFREVWGPRGVTSAADEAAALRRAESVHPLVEGYVRLRGWDRLRRLAVDHEVWGEKIRREEEAEWSRFVERALERDAAEYGRLGPGRERAGLRRVDPLAAIGERRELSGGEGEA